MVLVEPNDTIGQNLCGTRYPNKDETASNDGWAVISGTSTSAETLFSVMPEPPVQAGHRGHRYKRRIKLRNDTPVNISTLNGGT